MRSKLGPLLFQFGYLNKQKMASQAVFLDRLDVFVSQLPAGYTWCIEPRNPNYLNAGYFSFLREHGLAQGWLQGITCRRSSVCTRPSPTNSRTPR